MEEKKTIVLGASSNPERYSNLAVKRLRKHGHPVVAVGLKEEKIDDVNIQTKLPEEKDVDTITMYLNPMRQKQYYDSILALKPKRIIFNPGAENPELEALAQDNDIEP